MTSTTRFGDSIYNGVVLDSLLYAIKRPYHLVRTGLLEGLPAQIKYKFPAKKLTIICITGTDGKTTSSTMLYTVLKAAGKKVALLSTVAAYVGDESYDTGFHVTSPSPADLQRFMRMMVDKGLEYLVLEATSHGIYQYRTWGVTPRIVGVTNITHEHLDYHLSYDRYVDAKALLMRKAPVVVLNESDQATPRLRRILKPGRKIIEYGPGVTLPKVIETAIQKRFDQDYNQANASLVSTIAIELGLQAKAIASGITGFTSVPGRMQVVTPPKYPFTVIVDFAHTPNALEHALQAMRQQLKKQRRAGRLIAVFGCAGLRDQTKRPLMGAIGAKLADTAIFTAEDPRTEDIWSIIRQMKESVKPYHNKIISIPDRGTAITYALEKVAKPGDMVGIFGKGHEQSMCYGTTETPWSDISAVTKILKL